MKEIKAILQPHMLNRVMDALHNCEHFPGATISDCQGQGRGGGAGGHYEPTQESIFFVKKVQLAIFCSDQACEHLVALIRKTARTGNPGDGIVVIADLERVARIRTDQEQDEAV
jgi:nitrogen regulatory protein P-II 1